ncbi:MAG: hypothetical protein WBV94_23715 [Blastocatellia bacterium]
MAASLINTECKRYGCIKNLLACYANCRYSGRCDDLKTEILDKTDQAAKDISTYLVERGRKPITIQIMKRGVKFTDIANVKNVIPAKRERPAKNERAKSERRQTRINNVSTKPIIGARAKIEAQKAPARRIDSIRLKRKKSRKRASPKSSISFKDVESNIVNLRKARTTSYLEKSQALSKQKQKPARRRRQNTKSGKKITAHNSSEPNKRESITMPRRAITKSIESPVVKESVSNITSGESAMQANKKMKTPRAAKRKSSSKSKNNKVYIILDGKTASIVDEQGLMQHLFSSPSPGARYFEASEVEARLQIAPKK